MVTQLRKKIVRFPKTKKIFPFTIVVIVLLLSSNFYLSRTFFTFHASAQSTGIAAISGEMKKWHPVTLSFTGPQANETDGQAIQPTNTPTNSGAVTSFSLINADTDQIIRPLFNNDIINYAQLGTSRINIVANTSPSTVGSVRFGFDGNTNFLTENGAPYAVRGNNGSDYNPWTPSLGSHTLIATPYPNGNAGGAAGTPLSVTFTIVDDATLPTATPVPTNTPTPPTATPTSAGLPNDPNPFLDYRLQVTFTSPTGQTYTVPGFFDGDGNGGGSGNIWRVKFNPSETGTWNYRTSFRQGANVAIDLSPTAGTPTGFDDESGSFTIADTDPSAPGFLKYGLLEYVGKHYLKHRDGPYFIKNGADSPEGYLAYEGFDNTIPGTCSGLRRYLNHAQDWQPGDPDWGNGKGKAIIGTINYLSSINANSIYFMPMNIGGDCKDTWPFVGPINRDGSSLNDNTHYDISKLAQWDVFFTHAQRKGVMLHFVLNEAEEPNKKELDNALLGNERKLYYRELIARFGYHNAIVWNISEEYDLSYNLGANNVKEFAGYIQTVDPYDHPITVHNSGTSPNGIWDPFLGDSRFSLTSFQNYLGNTNRGSVTEEWRTRSKTAGRPIPISFDEFRATTVTNADLQRKEIVWPNLISGGNLEYILAGPNAEEKVVEDFRIFESHWNYSWIARKFIQDNLPFWEMEPNDGLLTGESTALGSGHVFAKAGQIYAIYLPNATPSGALNLTTAPGVFTKQWFNPRSGYFEGAIATVTGGGNLALGTPPSSPSEDWIVIFRLDPNAPSPTPTPTLTVTPTPSPSTGQAIISFTLINADTDQDIRTLTDGETIDFSEIGTNRLNIRANTNPPTVGSVRFGYDTNTNYLLENNPPYAFQGNDGADYRPWTPTLGTHTVTATPYTLGGGSGTPGTQHGITIHVTN